MTLQERIDAILTNPFYNQKDGGKLKRLIKQRGLENQA